jgi:hypothetical protein
MNAGTEVFNHNVTLKEMTCSDCGTPVSVNVRPYLKSLCAKCFEQYRQSFSPEIENENHKDICSS